MGLPLTGRKPLQPKIANIPSHFGGLVTLPALSLAQPEPHAPESPSATPVEQAKADTNLGLRHSDLDRIAHEAHGQFVMVLGGVLGLALLWAGFTEIDRVTRGAGKIIPQKLKQEVQHLEGGIITDIMVREGERVRAGQPLVRVENTFFRSELAQAAIERASRRLKMARLDAETSGKPVVFPADLIQSMPRAVENEEALYRRRKANLDEQISILTQQARQKEIELSELRSRQPLVLRERKISEERLAILSKLSNAGAASLNETLEAERLLQQALTRLSDLAHDIPRNEAALSEIAQKKAQIVSAFQAEAEKERTQAAIDLQKLDENIHALQERLRRSEVSASIAGTVNKLNVLSVGAVVKPGEAIAEIVPTDEAISVEMRLAPADRGNVWPGEKAIVKVSAYDYSVHGGLSARVVDISPDALQDERGNPYFRVRLEADAKGFGENKPVLPGMQADVDVIGQRQSVLASLIKPIRRITDNALRQ